MIAPIKKYFFPISIIATFLFLPLLMTLTSGVCCSDDAAHAVVAKNIAHGLGYYNSLNYIGADFKGSSFDPALGQGPVGILPVSLMLWLFGINPITPGLTQIIIECLLLLLITKLLLASFSVKRVSAFLLISLTLISLISTLSYEQWYAMLGESISALLLFCAYLMWNSHNRSTKYIILTGIFFSLAVLTKEISAIFVIAFMIVVILQGLFHCRNSEQKKVSLSSILMLSVSGALPFLVFEFCRFYKLGWQGWIINWRNHIAIVKFLTSTKGIKFSLFDQYQIRSQLLENSFFMGLTLFALIAVISSVLLIKTLKFKHSELISPIGLGIFLSFFNWTFLSSGPARYLYIGVLIWCFYISFPLLTHKNLLKACLPSLCSLILILPASWDGFNMFIKPNLPSMKTGIAANASEFRVLNYLHVNKIREKIYTPWWAHVAALEYLSSKPALFNGGAFSEKRPGSTVIINWIIAKYYDGLDKTNEQLSAHGCAQVFSSERYSVFRCAPVP